MAPHWFYVPASAPVLWTPAEEANIAAHFDAKTPSSITYDANGASVLTCVHGTEATAVQSDNTYKPAYNGSDCLTFNSDRMDINVSACAGFFVVKNCNGGSSSAETSPLLGNTDESNILLKPNSSVGYTASIDGQNSSNRGDISINGHGLYPGDLYGTDILYGGYLPFPNRNEWDIFYFQIHTNRTWTWLGGLLVASVNQYLKSDIGEVVLLNSLPTVEKLRLYEGYLSHRWQA